MRKISSVLVMIILALTLMPSVFASEFDSGNGSGPLPYLISTPEQLAHLASQVNGGNNYSNTFFKLANDIDLGIAPYNTGDGWTSIGLNANRSFQGKFDGNNFKILNIYSAIGLFGTIGENGEVKNLGIVGGNIGINNGGGMGSIASRNDGLIENCYNTANVSSDNWLTGGIVGINNGTITKCYNTGNVSNNQPNLSSSSYYTGGIAGGNSGIIERCYNTSVVASDQSIVGGITGQNDSGAVVENCYNIGKVISRNITQNTNYLGGIIGFNNGGTVRYCYNISDVIGPGGYPGNDIAGISYGKLSNCYHGGGVFMTKQETYINWDFDTVWSIDEGESYPYLRGIANVKEPGDFTLDIFFSDLYEGIWYSYINYKNTYSKAKEFRVIAAVYDSATNGLLTLQIFDERVVTTLPTQEYIIDLNGRTTGMTCKLLFWDGPDTMRPIFDEYVKSF